MSIIIDLVILLIIGLCVFFGYRKGLIGVAFKIITFFVALIVALTLSYPISNFIISNTNIPNKIETSIQEKFVTNNEKQIEDEKDIEIKNENFSKEILNYIDKSANEIKEEGVKFAVHNLTVIIIRAIVAISLYVITKFILFFFRKLAEQLAEIPIIKQFNKAGGLIYGIVKGLLIIYVTFAILSLIAPTLNNTEILISVNKSFIGNAMYNNNLLLKIIL